MELIKQWFAMIHGERKKLDQTLNKWLGWKERMVTMEMLCDLALWQRQHACEDWMGLKL